MNEIDGSLLTELGILSEKMNKKLFIELFHSVLSTSEMEENIFRFTKPIKIKTMNFWVLVYFDERLKRIYLNNSDTELFNTYQNWSNDRNGRKRESHDNWLKEQLGEADEKKDIALLYKRKWGEATSYIDMKNGEVGIVISYR